MPNLSKPTISPIDGENPLDNVSVLGVGLKWDKTTAGKRSLFGRVQKEIGSDLDLIAFLYQGDKPVKYAGFDNTDPLKTGALTTIGDNTSGAGEGDDELIIARLDRIPAAYTSILFTAGAFKKGSSLDNVANIESTVYDGSDGSMYDVATIMPSLLLSGNMMAVCKVTRGSSGLWTLRVIDESASVTQGDMTSLLRFAANY